MQVCKNLAAIQDRINRLEAADFRVRLVHEPKTTHTTTMIIDHEDATKGPFYGLAVCHKNDQFSRATGTRVAFNRVINDMSHQLGRDVVKALFA